MFLGPWSEMHRLNLGWFIAEWNKFYAEWQSTLQAITGALTGEIERVEAAMTDLYAARDAAAASATSANSSALNASASSLAAMDARDAAVSAKNTALSAASSAIESETAAGNSATLASSKAAQAATSATTAGEKATQAASSATTAGEKATQAASSASAAQQSETDSTTQALKAEGFAVGQQNGVDVASGSPYYHNNAKYYAEQGGGGGGAGVAFLTPELALTRMSVHDGSFSSSKKLTKIEQNTVTITPITIGTDSEVFCVSNPTPRKTGSSIAAYTPQLADLVPFTTPFNIEYFIAKAVGMTGACGIRIIPCSVNPDTQEITKVSTIGANPASIGFNSVTTNWGDTSGITHYAVLVQQASSFEFEYTFMFAKPTAAQLGTQSLGIGDDILPYNPPAETM